ncbi:MAG: hypothetical protein ACYSOD_00785 [Planctomycetota bacterium]
MVSLHNLTYYQRLMKEIRSQIENKTYNAWADAFCKKYKTEN